MGVHMEAFVYVWTDKITNMLYVGVHKGSDTDGYICSSKHMLKEYKLRPDTFTRQVIAHGSWDDMRSFETKILTSVDAARSEMFYNKSNGNGKFYCSGHTKETREKMSNTWKEKGVYNVDVEACRRVNLGSKRTEETKAALSRARKGKPSKRKGVKHTNNQKQNYKKSMLNKYGVENISQVPEVIQRRKDNMIARYSKIPSFRTDYSHSDETKAKISEANKGRTGSVKGRKKYYSIYDHNKFKFYIEGTQPEDWVLHKDLGEK